MAARFLSHIPENEPLNLGMQDCRSYVCATALQGPRFGFLTLMARAGGVHVFDTPALKDLPDVATDGASILVRACALRAALAESRANPELAPSEALILLAGSALAAAKALGLDEPDPLGVALAALSAQAPAGGGSVGPSLAGASFGTVSPARLNQLLAKDHPRAAQFLSEAHAGSKLARQNVVKALEPEISARAPEAPSLLALARALPAEGSRVLPKPDASEATEPVPDVAKKLRQTRQTREAAKPPKRAKTRGDSPVA